MGKIIFEHYPSALKNCNMIIQYYICTNSWIKSFIYLHFKMFSNCIRKSIE